MIKRIQILLLSLMLSMSSCITYKSEPSTVEPPLVINPITDFPVSYSLKPYTRQPVIDKQDNNFIVSDEFVENSILLKKYNDKIENWKNKHKIQ